MTAQSGRLCKSLRSEIDCVMEPESLASIAETRLGLLALWMLVATATLSSWMSTLYTFLGCNRSL